MITNATITLIKAPPVATSSGKMAYGEGTVVNVPCFLDEPRRNQIVALANRGIIATAIAYIWKPATISIAPQSRVTISVDGSTAIEYETQTWNDLQKDGGLSHFECALKAVK